MPTNILAIPKVTLDAVTGNNEDWIDSLKYLVEVDGGTIDTYPQLDLRGIRFEIRVMSAHRDPETVADYAKNCAARLKPLAYHSRRELIPASLHVDPVPGYGAIQTGEHLFYERHGAKGEEKLAGRARFAHVWALGADGKWRLSRILSFDHHPAQ